MPSRLFTLLLIPLLALVAACGGPAVQPASSRSDAAQLLRDTFANLSQVKSGDVSLRLRSPSAQGPVAARLDGPFASTGRGRLPRFAFGATFSAAGRTQRVGATWTGEKAFITLQNTPYAVSDLVAREFTAGFEQALGTGRADLDFTRWLRNPRNAGTAQVGGTPAVEITGQADVPRVVGDLTRISQGIRALGLPAGAPAQLTPQQRAQLSAGVRSATVQVYTGAQDRILRRLVVHGVVGKAAGRGTLDLDLRLTHVNAGVQISAPAHPKPFSALLNATGALDGAA